MANELKLLRNTITGLTDLLPAKFLKHPVFKNYLVEVNSEKPEVLAKPYTVDSDGDRKPVDTPAPESEEKE